MANNRKRQINEIAGRGLQSVQTLSVQFVTYLIAEGAKGEALEKIIATFVRHQTKLISGLLGSAGLAGGVWAAASLWTSSLGLWGSLGYAIGLVTMPAWIPIAGGAAGLSAAGGAIYGALHLAKGRQQTHELRAIIGFSKMLMGRAELEGEDDKLLRRFLKDQDIEEKHIGQLLATTAQEAKHLAEQHLNIETRRQVARYIFPLVYQHQGIISDVDRRRFTRVCSHLHLNDGVAREISQAYRQRLNQQWDYIRQLIEGLNFFAARLRFDSREMELVREELDQLMHFDPRRSATVQRERLLVGLGQLPHDLDLSGQTAESALMGAYAMAHTPVPELESLSTLAAAFAELLDCACIEKTARKKLEDSRKKIDQLYAATHKQITKMALVDGQEER